MNTVQRVLVCAVVALLTCPTMAQRSGGRVFEENPFDGDRGRSRRRAQQEKVKEEDTQLIVRVYDISALLIVPAAYPAQHEGPLSRAKSAIFPHIPVISPAGFGGMGGMGMGGMGGMGMGGGGGFGGGAAQGGGFFSVPEQIDTNDRTVLGQSAPQNQSQPQTAIRYVLDQLTPDDLIETITSTVAPDTWDEVGGEGSIQPYGQTLVISQTAAVHDQVSTLLQQLRSNRPTVTLHAYWLWQTNDQVMELMQSKRKGEPRGIVPPDRWQKWLSAPAPEGVHHYLASITCFSGQTVHVQAGVQNLHVAGITPVVGSEPGYAPQVVMVQDGAVLQVTPVCRTGDELITLDVHSRVTLRHPSEPNVRQPGVEVGNTPLQAATAVDRPVLHVQRLSTTTRLPMDQVKLIGGMNFAEDVDARNLYLYVMVSPSH